MAFERHQQTHWDQTKIAKTEAGTQSRATQIFNLFYLSALLEMVEVPKQREQLLEEI